MRKLVISSLCSLLTLSAMALPVQAASTNYGNSVAVAVGTNSNGAVQPYTDWGRSRIQAEDNALQRCSNFAYDCYIEDSWSRQCRFIAYTRYEVIVTSSRRNAYNFCDGADSCVNLVQRCPR